VQGCANFETTPVEFLWDSGASKTIISQEAFDRIKADNPDTLLISYIGEGVYSANNKLDIAGIVRIKCATFGKDSKYKGLYAIVS
jgi:hypothetical protein